MSYSTLTRIALRSRCFFFFRTDLSRPLRRPAICALAVRQRRRASADPFETDRLVVVPVVQTQTAVRRAVELHNGPSDQTVVQPAPAEGSAQERAPGFRRLGQPKRPEPVDVAALRGAEPDRPERGRRSRAAQLRATEAVVPPGAARPLGRRQALVARAAVRRSRQAVVAQLPAAATDTRAHRALDTCAQPALSAVQARVPALHILPATENPEA